MALLLHRTTFTYMKGSAQNSINVYVFPKYVWSLAQTTLCPFEFFLFYLDFSLIIQMWNFRGLILYLFNSVTVIITTNKDPSPFLTKILHLSFLLLQPIPAHFSSIITIIFTKSGTYFYLLESQLLSRFITHEVKPSSNCLL